MAEDGKDRIQLFQLQPGGDAQQSSPSSPSSSSSSSSLTASSSSFSASFLSSSSSSSSSLGSRAGSESAAAALELEAKKQFRLRRLLAEHRVRTQHGSAWDLSDGHAYHEIQKIVIAMVNTAVDEAVERAELGVY